MPQLNVGIHLPSLRQPFKKAMRTAASLGAAGVEIDARTDVRPAEFSATGLRQLRRLLADLNLRVSAVTFITRRGYDVEEDLARRVDATKAAMKLAYDLRAKAVVNYIGRIPSDMASREWNTLVQALADLGAYGQHVGAFVAARTGGESAEDLQRLLAALPEGYLGLDLDPRGMIINGFSPLGVVEKLGRHVLHVHARDGVRDLGRGRGAEVPLGRGEAEFPALTALLDQQGYRGWYTLERSGENAALEIGQGVRYLKSL
jgi:sugar phosphate isomerase/epimerase